MMDTKKVLVIENDREFLEILEYMLDALNYSVITAYDGREALKKVMEAQADQMPFDLIITDVYIPEISGGGVVQNLRVMGIDTPVVAITALPTEILKQKMFNLGCTGWLEKPFTEKQLQETIEELLKRGEIEQ